MATVERFVSYYGDGAVLDSAQDPDNLRHDDDGPTCIVRVVMPKAEYLKIWYYTRRDNMGPEPLSDAYEAAQVIAVTATETEVISCDACDEDSSDWGKRLPCYLCGSHEHKNG